MARPAFLSPDKFHNLGILVELNIAIHDFPVEGKTQRNRGEAISMNEDPINRKDYYIVSTR